MCNEISKLNIIQSGVIKSEDVEGIVNYIVASGKLTGFNLNIASEGLCLPEFFMFFSTVLQRMSDDIGRMLFNGEASIEEIVAKRLNDVDI